MFDHDHGDAEFATDVEDEPRHVLGLFLVHARNGLVEKQQLWVHGEGSSELYAFLDAVGKQRNGGLAESFDLEEVDDVFAPAAVLHLLFLRCAEPHCTGEPRTLHAHMSTGEQVVDHGHVREEFDVLERAGNSHCGDLVRTLTHDRVAVPANVALLGAIHLRQRVEDRRLASAVRANDREQLTLVDMKTDVVDGGHATETQRDVLYFKKMFAHR